VVTHISRYFVCFLPLFALQLEGPRRQTEPPSYHTAMRQARQAPPVRVLAPVDRCSFFPFSSVLPDSFARLHGYSLIPYCLLL